MAGRRPNTSIDTTKNHMGEKERKARKDATPVYEKQDFIPPDTLSEPEKKTWEWLTMVFRETINCPVSDADRHLMETYCKSKATYDEADKQIKADPRPLQLVVTGYKEKDGQRIATTTSKPNPWYKIRREEGALMLKLFDQLGLSPVARARIGLRSANAKEEDKMWQDLFNRSDE